MLPLALVPLTVVLSVPYTIESWPHQNPIQVSSLSATFAANTGADNKLAAAKPAASMAMGFIFIVSSSSNL